MVSYELSLCQNFYMVCMVSIPKLFGISFVRNDRDKGEKNKKIIQFVILAELLFSSVCWSFKKVHTS